MDMIYTPSSATDILSTWRRFGYVPPSELEEYQAKWDYYQSLPTRKENPPENVFKQEIEDAISHEIWEWFDMEVGDD